MTDTERAPIPAAPSDVAGDIHIRAERDGLRLYDGLLRLEGPWSVSEYPEAMSALLRARAALASLKGGS